MDGREEFDEQSLVRRVPAICLKSFEETVPFLVQEEGLFQAWINIGPAGITNQEIVFEISIPNRWTDNIITGELAFPCEPFLIVGPPLPAEWNKDTPIPIVKLPLIKILADY